MKRISELEVQVARLQAEARVMRGQLEDSQRDCETLRRLLALRTEALERARIQPGKSHEMSS